MPKDVPNKAAAATAAPAAQLVPVAVLSDDWASTMPWELEHEQEVSASDGRAKVSVVGKLEFLEKLKEEGSTLSFSARRDRLTTTIFSTFVRQKLNEGHSIFPYLRLLIPQADTERKSYGLAEKTMARAIASAVGLGPAQTEELEEFENPQAGVRARLHHHRARTSTDTGHFARTVFQVLQYQFETESEQRRREAAGAPRPLRPPPNNGVDRFKWTVGDVNSWLDRLYAIAGSGGRGRGGAAARGEGALDKQRALFQELWRHVTPRGIKWIVRIVLGDMAIGQRHEKILEMYHTDAPAQLAVAGLRETLHHPLLRPGGKGIRAVIRLNTAFLPMTCGRYTTLKGLRNSTWNVFYVERKMDGERVLIHKDGDNITFFTRNRIREERYERHLRSYILSHVKAERCILDGEMVTWSDTAGGYLPFGYNKPVAAAQGLVADAAEAAGGAGGADAIDAVHALAAEAGLDAHMCYLAFDCLYLEGPQTAELRQYCDALGSSEFPEITHLPLRKRKGVLDRVLPVNVEHRLEVLTAELVSKASDSERKQYIDEQIEAAIRRSDEGIIIKLPESVYKVGKRELDWLKVKPEFFDGVAQELDLAIIGAYYGKGSRGGATDAHRALRGSQSQATQSAGSGTGSSGSRASVEPVASFLMAAPARGWHTLPGGKAEDGTPLLWTPVCKTGSGLTLSTLAQVRRLLNPWWRRVDKLERGSGRDNKTVLPQWMWRHCRSWNLAADDVPDVVLDTPIHAMIMTITGAQVVDSSAFPATIRRSGGLLSPATIRFPRFMKSDGFKVKIIDEAAGKFENYKPLADCDSEETLQRIWDTNGGRMFKPKPGVEGEITSEENATRRRKASQAGKRAGPGGRPGAPKLLESDRGTDLSVVRVMHDLFRGQPVVVLRGDYKGVALVTKPDGEQAQGRDAVAARVTALGGVVRAHCAGDASIRYVVGDIQQGEATAHAMIGYDVRSVAWLEDCEACVAAAVGQGQRVDTSHMPEPRRAHFLYITRTSEDEVEKYEDKYGDVHGQELQGTGEQLGRILARVTVPVAKPQAARDAVGSRSKAALKAGGNPAKGAIGPAAEPVGDVKGEAGKSLPAPVLQGSYLMSWTTEELRDCFSSVWTLFRDFSPAGTRVAVQHPYDDTPMDATASSSTAAKGKATASASGRAQGTEVRSRKKKPVFVIMDSQDGGGEDMLGMALAEQLRESRGQVEDPDPDPASGSSSLSSAVEEKAAPKKKAGRTRGKAPAAVSSSSRAAPTEAEADAEAEVDVVELLREAAPRTVAYVWRAGEAGEVTRSGLAGYRLQLHGGGLSSQLDKRVNVILCDPAALPAATASDVQQLKDTLYSLHDNCYGSGTSPKRARSDAEGGHHALPVPVVDCAWVDACVGAGTVMPLQPYLLLY